MTAVQYTNQRYEPYGALCGDPISYEVSPARAAIKLVRLELGYGGRVIEIEPNRVVTRTSCMGLGNSRYDITTFESDDDEAMKPVLTGIAFWADATKTKGKALAENTASALIDNELNMPIFAGMMTTMMFQGWVKPTLIAVACCGKPLTEDQVKTLADLKVDKDIFDSLIELLVEGSPFDEVLTAAV